jgi:hypothetical protein
MPTLQSRAKTIQKTPYNFSLYGGGIEFYPYQDEPINAVWNSVTKKLGMTFVIIISRQSGKDELLCHLKLYLMHRFQHKDVEIVEFNPTYKPQTIRAIFRLEQRLQANVLTRNRWKKRSDFMRMIGQAKTSFLSGDGKANVVGATASLLLIVNEAQDISPQVYDKKAAPMAASTNATRVIVGTVWTSNSLLSREKRRALQAEKEDGMQRVFMYDADFVRKFNTHYGNFVDGEIARLGREHPLIKTQYFNEEIDAQADMFNDARRALMKGDKPEQKSPIPGHAYAFLIDVAGQDEARMNIDDDAPLENPGRDSLAMSIIEIDLSSLEILRFPTYRVVARLAWTGENHVKMYAKISALGAVWQPQRIVIDATGVGEGLWSMLDRAFPGIVMPFKFTASSKSELGYGFLAVINTGRFRDCAPSEIVNKQYQHIQSEILPGPNKTLRWSVPEGTRDPDTGELIHDDHVIADSMVAELDKLDWAISTAPVIIHRDLQSEIDGAY